MLQLSLIRGTQGFVNEEAAWVVSRSEVLFRNPHVEVRDETVVIPGENHPRHWTVVGRKKAVVIAPVTLEGRFVLIRQAGSRSGAGCGSFRPVKSMKRKRRVLNSYGRRRYANWRKKPATS